MVESAEFGERCPLRSKHAAGSSSAWLFPRQMPAKQRWSAGSMSIRSGRSWMIHFVNNGNGIMPVRIDGDTLLGDAQHYAVDFKDVRGQQTAKRALEISRRRAQHPDDRPQAQARPCWPSACQR